MDNNDIRATLAHENCPKDTYDGIVDGIANFAGILAGTVVWFGTANVPANDNASKHVLRYAGRISLSSVVSNVTTMAIIVAGEKLKPYICKK